MAKKIIYFVRHGETENNALNIKQDAQGGLDEKGRTQVLTTAKRFPKEHGRPQIIIASPFERTKETAEIIANEIGIKKIEYTPLLAERKNPSEVVGHFSGEVGVKRIIEQMDKSYHPDNLRISDEENFTDLKNRAMKLLKFIKHRSEERIIMVTHKNFLKMVVSTMLYGKKLTASEYNTLSYHNDIKNAGMAICTLESHWFKKNEWKILVWNDLD
jgi:broad specificity phosphatase PhoE